MPQLPLPPPPHPQPLAPEGITSSFPAAFAVDKIFPTALDELLRSTTSIMPETMPIQQLNLYFPAFSGVNSLTLSCPGVSEICPSNKLREIIALVQPPVPVSVISHLTGTPATTLKEL